MIFLVFPKKFEMFNFILQCYFMKRILFLCQDNDIDGLFLVRLKMYDVIDGEKKRVHVFFYCFYLNESDISFNLRFHKKLNEIIDSKPKLKRSEIACILCGTCGADEGKLKIGDTVFITKATKFDRGYLDEEMKLQLKDADFLSEDAKVISKNTMTCATALSSNHISHMSSVKFARDHHILGLTVFEMETFDFFSVCKLNNVRVYGCLRIVSDSWRDKTESLRSTGLLRHFANFLTFSLHGQKGDPEFQKEISRLNRKLLDMETLVEHVELVLPQIAINGAKSIKNSKYLEEKDFGDFFVQREVNTDIANIYKFPILPSPHIDKSLNYGVHDSIVLLSKEYVMDFQKLIEKMRSIRFVAEENDVLLFESPEQCPLPLMKQEEPGAIEKDEEIHAQEAPGKRRRTGTKNKKKE